MKGAQATTAIEGNTLSPEEVERIYRGQASLPPSRKYLETEVSNVLNAFNWLLDEVVNQNRVQAVTPDLIREFHRRIAQNLGECMDAAPGRWREDRRQVGAYLAPEHRHVPELVEQLCRWLQEEFHFHKEQDFRTAVIEAIVAHLYLEWIHPFGDGNGRTGRLLEYYILLRAGLPSIASHVLSNFYNITRSEYYRQIMKAWRKNDLTSFISYAVQGLRDGLAEQLSAIQYSQTTTFWENHIHGLFNSAPYNRGERNKRLHKLAISVPLEGNILPEGIIAHDDSLKVQYSRLAKSALTRDLKALVGMGLLRKNEDSTYSANSRLLVQFFPAQRA